MSKNTKPKIFITGATGFTGSRLARRLVTNGYGVHILMRETSNTWRIQDILPKITVHESDLSDARKLRTALKAAGAGIIFHFANAGVYGGKHLSDAEMMEVNFQGTANLLAAAGDVGFDRFIHTGSSSEYGPRDHPMKETDTCEPNSSYGTSKLSATLLASKTAQETGKFIITLRLFSVYGPHDDPSRLIAYAASRILTGQNLELGSPDAVRDYIYVEDIVDLCLSCIDIDRNFCGDVFNVGSGTETKIKTVIDTLTELTNYQGTIHWNVHEGRSFDTAHWQADITKVTSQFGWRPETSLGQGLGQTLDWFKKHLLFYPAE